jgi:hypothetical protein
MENNSTKMKILICCHRQGHWKSDNVYLPIHVGKTLSNENLHIQGDDEGDNISKKNKSYCELTGLYWAWKNLKDVEYIGLCHYRRYFNFHNNLSIFKKKKVKVKCSRLYSLNLNLPDMHKLFKNTDIILVKPEKFKVTLSAQYACCHVSDDYDTLKKVVNELTPEYNQAFLHIFENNNRFSPYNMFITSWTVFDEFMSWLFLLLEELEQRVDISQYDAYQCRVFAFLAERLLNVFVYKKQLRTKYLPIHFLVENES